MTGPDFSRTIMTIGHSNHPIESFLQLLLSNSVSLIIDVRTIPRSRHNPQFNKELLPATLENDGINYIHAPGLGGLRRTVPDSINTAWNNASFRGYADYMQTEEFQRNLQKIIDLDAREVPALMCAESLPWKCHRWLVADALAVRNLKVVHIMSNGTLKPHALTSWAVVSGVRVSYPSEGTVAL